MGLVFSRFSLTGPVFLLVSPESISPMKTLSVLGKRGYVFGKFLARAACDNCSSSFRGEKDKSMHLGLGEVREHSRRRTCLFCFD